MSIKQTVTATVSVSQSPDARPYRWYACRSFLEPRAVAVPCHIQQYIHQHIIQKPTQQRSSVNDPLIDVKKQGCIRGKRSEGVSNVPLHRGEPVSLALHDQHRTRHAGNLLRRTPAQSPTAQYSKAQHSTVQHSTVQYSTRVFWFEWVRGESIRYKQRPRSINQQATAVNTQALRSHPYIIELKMQYGDTAIQCTLITI